MIKISMNVDETTIERIVENMPMRFKLKLVRKLEEVTRKKRWGRLFKIIDKNFKNNPVTEEEIAREVAAVRKKRYAQGRR